MKLKYGREKLEFDDERLPSVKILEPNERQGLVKPLDAVRERLKNPLGAKPLTELVKQKAPEQVVIVVNDVSRPTPYQHLLPPLLAELEEAGVTKEEIIFVIATGIHDPNTAEENEEIFGEWLAEGYQFVSHSPDQDLVDLGQLSSGNQLQVNRRAVEADLLITIGVIAPHYFAGFSGGRKSILPGIAGRESIQFNHSQMVELLGDLPPVVENPVNLEMIEAARKAEVDFILNVVTNSKKEIVEVVAGDLEEAWYAGVETSAQMYHVPIDKQADLALVSAGGYPKDINIYQAQKALDNANAGVKPGGTIILLAECSSGLGEDVFVEWVNTSQQPEDNIERIKEKFVLGGHKAFAISKVVMDKEFILISGLDEELSEALFAKKVDSIDEALAYVEEKHGADYQTIIMPQGGLTVPVNR
ncbi:nickel-dependent lactate racemase [Natroniella acetigena]|uniref:nickel-dependent lactate racemase n=1 Tax=Natroniella acetigena TaxID=52004 RepID=UPI00200B5C80|nr:nickel-dependent lactate racemase [Natroniella acetigena]MCK8826935.1 nickel-dependent lactate racemase [Natroniella acetigena]